jgi:hypothetical protein
MTETVAWQVTAEAFAKPWSKRTPREKRMTDRGLCFAMTNLGHWLYNRLSDGGYWWPVANGEGGYGEYDDYRATYAGFMAAMTQAEREEVYPL